MRKSLLVGTVLALALGCGDDGPAEMNLDAGLGPADGGSAEDAGSVTADGGGDSDAGDVPGSDAGPVAPGELVRLGIEDLEFAGAFRVSPDGFGDSTVNYAVGALGFNPERNTLFIAGHAQHNMVAEVAIPAELGMDEAVSDLPVVTEPLQNFAPLLNRTPSGNGDRLDRITGMMWRDGDLIVNAHKWYDAAGTARDTTLVVPGGDLSAEPQGYFQFEGAARGSGFMAMLPAPWNERFGAPALAGWASNLSIISRYSVGPSFFAFDPATVAGEPGAEIPARPWLDYPHGGGEFLDATALEYTCFHDDDTDVTTCQDDPGASALWNIITQAMVGFVVPGTRTYALFGHLGGSETGIGYKIRQDNGNLCGGPCARGADDYDNYYWFYDLDEILAAENTYDPRPYAYGPWEVPYDDDADHAILGGTFDADNGRFYLAIEGAGQVGDYDYPPLFLAFDINVADR